MAFVVRLTVALSLAFALALSPIKPKPPKIEPVTIHLNATILMVNSISLGLTCSVQRHPDNRSLCFGLALDDYSRDSCEQLDGDGARVTFGPTYYAHIPCGEGTAYCVVQRNDGTTATAVQSFRVVGCNEKHR